ncbi:hypothetical protein CKM354_000109200 [Cercospora kikuchii]|uniref:MYND-type domain-containing protein n=1 Tax=Cercospora kikuchii TaxID=84275 RepID=A0A9P3FCL7_9PEZI|nr:uncharacterized protein CKM354_000109200 [Cercospora kikuchii]GIZ37650.1 hypothetical protein CKM354_000109200 [Cercospora kikuchii]
MLSVHGPQGVSISWDERVAQITGMKLPFMMHTPLAWSGHRASSWKDLKLCNRLRIPLRYIETENTMLGKKVERKVVNKTLEIFSIDAYPTSSTFGRKLVSMKFDVTLSREDGRDLVPKHVEAIMAFIESELQDLVAYADQQAASNISTSNNLAGNSTSNSTSADDDKAAEAKPATRTVTRAEAQAAAAKATPENFAAFFKKYRAEQAVETPRWAEIECPAEALRCFKCQKVERDDWPLQSCGGCKLAKYCNADKVCQSEDWNMHKTLCKIFGGQQ